jgi:biotin carboxyl carrier protein
MGDYLSPFGGADINLVGDAFDTFEDVYSNQVINATSAKLAYTAVDINNRVNRLDFEVSKTLAQTIYYYFYGVVFKYVVKKGDTVETGYV